MLFPANCAGGLMPDPLPCCPSWSCASSSGSPAQEGPAGVSSEFGNNQVDQRDGAALPWGKAEEIGIVHLGGRSFGVT